MYTNLHIKHIKLAYKTNITTLHHHYFNLNKMSEGIWSNHIYNTNSDFISTTDMCCFTVILRSFTHSNSHMVLCERVVRTTVIVNGKAQNLTLSRP